MFGFGSILGLLSFLILLAGGNGGGIYGDEMNIIKHRVHTIQLCGKKLEKETFPNLEYKRARNSTLFLWKVLVRQVRYRRKCPPWLDPHRY